MDSGWAWITLGDLVADGVATIQTGPFGSQLHAHDYVDQGVPVIPTEAIGHRRLRHVTVPMVAPETADRLSRHKVRPGDILFARRGVQATGLSALIEDHQAGWICGTGALLLRLSSAGVDPTFLSFALSSSETINWLKSQAVGAVMPNLNPGILNRLPIFLPPLPEQHTVAEVLGALDDKIDVNRRMNSTLESIAQALFRSWFIDCDPVRAKAEGRTPSGMDAETAALFPDAFDDTALGPAPRGWEVRPIGDVVEVKGGSTPSTSNPAYWSDGSSHWATPRDMSRLDAPILLDTERKITPEGLAQVPSGLLPVGTLLMSSRAPIGYLAISAVPTAVNQGFIAMPCTPPMTPYFLYFWAKANMEVIEGRANGTTFMEVSRRSFRPIPMLVPDGPVLAAFGVGVKPMFDLIASNLREIERLAAIRDYLLPRLLSGELRVGEVERLVEVTA